VNKKTIRVLQRFALKPKPKIFENIASQCFQKFLVWLIGNCYKKQRDTGVTKHCQYLFMGSKWYSHFENWD
jgi:hypothetical protein